MRMDFGRISSIIKKCSIPKIIFMVLCCVFFAVSLAGGLSSKINNIHIEKVKAAQKKITDDFKEGAEKDQAGCLRQDKNNKAVVLINTAENEPDNATGDKIQNIIVVAFSKNEKKGLINLIAMQKEMAVDKGRNGKLVKLKDAFDEDDPEHFYKILKGLTGYEVGSHIIYNNDTVKKIMDIKYIATVGLVQYDNYFDDVKSVNDNIGKYADKYSISDREQVSEPGMQMLRSAQTLAYLNMYNNYDFEGIYSNIRQYAFIIDLIREMKNCNLDEFERYRTILDKYSSGIDSAASVRYCAAIKTYRPFIATSWPVPVSRIQFKKGYYVVPDHLAKNLKVFHRKTLKEKDFNVGESTYQSEKRIKGVIDYIAAYNKKQAEKKRAAEAAKKREAEKEAAEKAKEDRNKTSSDTDTDKKDKTSDTGKSKSSSKKQSSSGSSGKKKTSSSGGNKKDSSGGSSSKPKPKPKPSSDSDDEQGEVVQPDNPEPTPDPQPEDSSHNSDSTDN